MESKLKAVILFHQTYGVPFSETPIAGIPTERKNLRFDLMKEENEEYLLAAANNDLVEIADSLGDMLYILCGTIIEHGLQHKIDEVFDEIQRSNMSKLGEDGKPIYREDGKVLKGPNYSKPNIAPIIFETAFEDYISDQNGKSIRQDFEAEESTSIQEERMYEQPDDVRHEGGE